MEEIIVPAQLEKLDLVQEFVGRHMEAAKLPARERANLSLVVEEVFVNIANYAYNPGHGDAVVRCTTDGNSAIVMEFVDAGKPFNPLVQSEPDINLPAEERDVGGLGIFLIRKLMDSVEYEYRDGKNKLTMRKCF